MSRHALRLFFSFFQDPTWSLYRPPWIYDSVSSDERTSYPKTPLLGCLDGQGGFAACLGKSSDLARK